MNDQAFLEWLHERLEQVHQENPCMDYMHRLRAIALATPPGRHSGTHGGAGSEDMRQYIARQSVTVCGAPSRGSENRGSGA